jgi:hypothetical protein
MINLRTFNLIKIFRKINYWHHINREAKKILIHIKNGVKSAIIVYDNKTSPPTYGDFFFSIMFGKYLTSQGINVIFYIIDSEYRSDWDDLSISLEGKDRFVDEQLDLAKKIINSNLIEIKRGSWNSYQNLSSKLPLNIIRPFSNLVEKRVAIYHHIWILLNLMVAKNMHHLFNLLLNGYELKVNSGIQKTPDLKYITIGCRFSVKWAQERNLSENEFLSIVNNLQNRFPSHLIMIVSCEEGCKLFSQIARQNNLNLIYSKEYSSTFIGDGALILNSEFFFILKGGGISVFSQFSDLPFECYQPTNTDLMWSENKLAVWQGNHQLYCNTEILPPDFC